MMAFLTPVSRIRFLSASRFPAGSSGAFFSLCSIVAAAVAWGAAGSGLGLALLAGLALCALGDVLLIPRAGPLLLAGMAAFGLGHVTFAAAFLAHGVAWPALAVGAAVAAVLAAVVWRWLGPRLGSADRLPVALYVVVIGFMLAGAAGALGAGAPPGLAVGGALFAASDLAVAQDRFVAPMS